MRYVNRPKVPGVCTRGPSRSIFENPLIRTGMVTKRNFTAHNLFSKRSQGALLIQPLALSVERLIMLLRIWKFLDSESDTGCPDCLFAPRQTSNCRIPPTEN